MSPCRFANTYQQNVSPKRWHQPTSLHGVTTQNDILTAVRTSNVTCRHPVCPERLYTSTSPHALTTRKTETDIFTTVRTSYLLKEKVSPAKLSHLTRLHLLEPSRWLITLHLSLNSPQPYHVRKYEGHTATVWAHKPKSYDFHEHVNLLLRIM